VAEGQPLPCRRTAVTVIKFPNTSVTDNGAGDVSVAWSDANLATTDVTTNNSSTAKHGFLKKLSNVATEYMDGTGAWSVPIGGGSAHSIEEEGTPLTARSKLNFVGTGVTVTDDAGDDASVVTIPGNPTITDAINVVLDGGDAAIVVGKGVNIVMGYSGTINSVTMLADQSGSIVVDIYKDTYTNYPPVNADSITGSAPPTISGGIKSQDSTLTGWTTSFAAGDILRFEAESVTDIVLCTIALRTTRS
jgi:hypothetical protein